MSAARSQAGLLSARLALRWLIGGEWRAHPWRFAATALAIAVGVALGFAVHLVNGSALASFEGAVRGVNGAADRTVRAASGLGLDEELYPRVLQAPGVADASPVVSLDASVGEAHFTLIGLDVIRAAAVTPSLIGLRPNGVDTASDDIFDPDALFLSRAALDAAKAAVGDRIDVAANGRTATMRIAGTLPGLGEGQAVGTMDIAAAQWRFDRLGRLDRIDLKLGKGESQAEATLRDLLPPGASLSSAETEAAQGSNLSRAYRVNLDMLALVALLTGGFLVFSAQSLSVARRLRAFALLRTLGLPRRGIVAAVAAEGLLIGAGGALVGLLVGAGLAVLALRWFGGDLGAGYFEGGSVAVAFPPVAATLFFLLGLAAAVLGSVLPARAASRAAPAAALKNAGDILDPRRPVPWKPAVILLATGGAASLAPAVNGLPILGFAGMALILAGGVAGVPWLARALLGRVRQWRGGVPADLALAHVRGAPSEAATALCGIVASTALMIAMATMVTSFRGAVDEWLGQVLSSDLYLRTEGGVAFDPQTQDAIRAVPGLSRVDFSRQLRLSIEPDRPPVVLIARPLDGGPSDALLVGLETASQVPPDAVPVWVSEPASRLYGWKTGATIALPIGKAGERFAVAGIWRDYARQFGAIAMRSADYERLTGDKARDEAAALVKPGADVDAVGRAMLEAVPDNARRAVSLARPQTLRAYALDLFDRSFTVTYVLEAVAILVGLAGVAATVSAQTVARAREFGMLRHLGLAKRQISRMLGVEGALLGLVGGLAGAGLGLVLAEVLIHVINPQSFNWTMDTRLPVGTIGGVVLALVAAAALTAVLAGRRATAKDAVLAVREDW